MPDVAMGVEETCEHTGTSNTVHTPSPGMPKSGGRHREMETTRENKTS